MIHYSKVAAGLRRYLSEDLVAAHKGTGKGWVLGAVLELAMMRVDYIYRWAVSIPLVNASGFVDGDTIDAEALYTVFAAQARQGNAVINIPVIGAREYTVDDVEKLYRYIKEA